ncbi:N-acetyltransferase [Acidovorax sp. JMULE5]|uniref:GNAT family N-acetyltransferase n=1 Tax=Acidovorax sp. JMULE5 TaxID=2518343 RepID=UPI00159F9872|nr:GNAT family N-acetyltransferase [Acidovorax sp. JMULE5]
MQPHSTSSQTPPSDALEPFLPVCGALAEALLNDPFYQAVTIDHAADPDRRLQVLTQYCELAMEEARAVGEVQVADPHGAALWITPQAPAADRAKHSAIRSSSLRQLLGPRGFDNYQRICAAMEAQVPADLHSAWYLSILGVQSAARGQGLAQRLLAPTLARADQAGATCFLETFNPLSVPFYRRLGFTQSVECVDSISGCTYQLMVRAAAARGA